MHVCAPRRVGRALLLAALVAAASVLDGCGPSEKIGEVEGRVTFNGQPVKEGTVVFAGPDGSSGETPLDQDGRYALTPPENRLRPGEYVVTITPLLQYDNPDPRKTSPEKVEKRAPNIPEKYRRVGSTPFRVTVKEGKNELNFDMKP